VLTQLADYASLWRVLRGLPLEEIRLHCRNLARTDLYFLLRYGLQRPDVERQWILDRCVEVQLEPDGYIDLWARDHYKSSVITLGKTIQDILASHGDDPLEAWEDKEPTFGIFSHTRPIAKGFLRQIKGEFERNKLLADWFPDVLWENPQKESPKWSEDDGIVMRRKSNPKESTVEAWGVVDGQPTSKHFDVLVYDDVVTLESVTGTEMISKTTDRWEVSLNLSTDGGVKRYIGTRYHDEDTYGTILERGVAKPRIYPATVDGTADGEPVLLARATLEEKKLSMSPFNFSSQLLLNPIPDDTAYFRSEWLQYYNDLPNELTFWGASDYAVTAGGGDYTVHGVVATDNEENIYVVDWWRKQTHAEEWVESFIDLAVKWDIRLWAEESGQINKGVGPFITKRMKERRAYFTREQFVPTKDKATRAQSIRGRMAMGKIFFPRKPFTQDLVSEILRFPVGKHDDQVDVLSLFGTMLEKFYGRAAPAPRKTTSPTQGSFILEQLDATETRKGRYAA
jgi:predicted phage terminase large subunit-like protein